MSCRVDSAAVAHIAHCYTCIYFGCDSIVRTSTQFEEMKTEAANRFKCPSLVALRRLKVEGRVGAEKKMKRKK